MRPLDIFKFATKSLTERKLRTGLTILMVVIGAALITSLNGLSGGFDAFMNDQFSSLAPNVLTISPSDPFEDDFGGDEKPIMTLTYNTVDTLKPISGAMDVIPSYRGTVKLSSAGKTQNVQMIGIDSSKVSLVIPAIEMESGNIPDPNDLTAIVLGFNIAHPSGADSPFAQNGDLVKVEFTQIKDVGNVQKRVTNGKSFLVKGIVEEQGNLIYDNAIIVPLSAADSLLDRGRNFDQIFIVTEDADMNDGVENEIREIYGNDIGITSPKSILEAVQNIAAGFQMFVFSIAVVSLIVGGVGIVTTLFTSVMERTKEIGTLKALGTSSSVILFIFMTESLIIGISGGFFGVTSGIAMGTIMSRFMEFGPPNGRFTFTAVFNTQDLVSVWLLATTLSVIAGIYPAWRASKLPPVVALRRD